MKTTSILKFFVVTAALMASAQSHAETLTFIPASPKRTEDVRMRVEGTAVRYNNTTVKVGMVGNKITVSARLLYAIPQVVTDQFNLFYRPLPFVVDLGRLPAGTYEVEFVGNRTDTSDLVVLERSTLIVSELDQFDARIPNLNYSDLWWNSTESGWGISIHVKNRQLFAAWFVYDPLGRPTWYTIQNCAWAGPDRCFGTVVKALGSPNGGLLGLPSITASVAGIADLNFTSYDTATLIYTVDGITSQKLITRQPF